MQSKDGAEVLIHIGLDTVKRDGKGFRMKIEAGQKVKKGELICEFDLEDMKADGYVMTTPVVISNNEEYASIALERIGECNAGEEILTLYK
jgi:phosphotransferase system IIA component